MTQRKHYDYPEPDWVIPEQKRVVWECVWKTLEQLGYCDSIGSQEFCRVSRAWTEAMCPLDQVGRFILNRTCPVREDLPQ